MFYNIILISQRYIIYLNSVSKTQYYYRILTKQNYKIIFNYHSNKFQCSEKENIISNFAPNSETIEANFC